MAISGSTSSGSSSSNSSTSGSSSKAGGSSSSGSSTTSKSSSTSTGSTPSESKSVSKGGAAAESRQGAAVSSAVELNSGGSSSSDPKKSESFARVQSEAAKAVAGTSAPTDSEAAEYRELRDRIEEIEENPPETFGLSVHPDILELDSARLKSELISLEAQGAYGSALGEVESAIDDLKETAAMVEKAELEAVPFMDSDQAAEFREYASEEVAKESPAIEEASARLVDELNDPVFQETLKDLPRAEQLDVIEGMARNLGFTEVGRGRLGSFVDGLTGVSDDPLAEVALDLQASLTGEDLAALERNLGLIAGIDGQARPDGAAARADSLRTELGVATGDSPFQTGVTVGNDSFAFAAEMTLDAVERLTEGSSSQALGIVGKVAGGAGAALDALGAVQALQEGDVLGALGSAAGVASFVAQVAPKLAPRLLTKVAGPLGVASTAIDVLQFVGDQAKYADFLRTGLDRAMGDDPLKAAVWGASEVEINLLGFDRTQPMRPQLENELAQVIGPQWRELDSYLIESDFWRRAIDTQMLFGSN